MKDVFLSGKLPEAMKSKDNDHEKTKFYVNIVYKNYTKAISERILWYKITEICQKSYSQSVKFLFGVIPWVK